MDLCYTNTINIYIYIENCPYLQILTTDVHQYVCFLCYTVLRQCRKLKQQAIWSEKVLKENANASIEVSFGGMS